MIDPDSRSLPAPGFLGRQRKSWWQKRKRKFYNPPGKCIRCGQQSTPHLKYCPTCISLFRWQGADSMDYNETLADIRSDWHQ